MKSSKKYSIPAAESKRQMVQKELKVMGWNEGFVLWVMELLKDFKVGMMIWFPFRIVSISVDVVTMPVCPVDIPWGKKKKTSPEGGQPIMQKVLAKVPV